MLSKRPRVNRICGENTGFPQDVEAFFRISYRGEAVNWLCIKRRQRSLFYFTSFKIMPLSVASHMWSSSMTAKVARLAVAR